MQGRTPFGSSCCASVDDGTAQHLPDFSSLHPAAKPGCNSDTAQYVVNQACLGKNNCTLLVRANRTVEWDLSSVTLQGESTELGCGAEDGSRNCSVKLGTGNYSLCEANPRTGAVDRQIGRASCRERV